MFSFLETHKQMTRNTQIFYLASTFNINYSIGEKCQIVTAEEKGVTKKNKNYVMFSFQQTGEYMYGGEFHLQTFVDFDVLFTNT